MAITDQSIVFDPGNHLHGSKIQQVSAVGVATVIDADC
jgi:hypothetical protein